MNAIMSEAERAENREIGMQVIRGIEHTFKVLKGEAPRDSNRIHELIAELKELAEVAEDE